MGLLDAILGAALSAVGGRDYSDGAKCPVCGSGCYWDDDECVWICDSCGYEVHSSQVEYNSSTDTVDVLDIDWYCDECDAYLNDQSGFNPYASSFTCKKCGCVNDITKDNVR